MSIVLQSSSGGSITINEPATASNFTQTLPAATGTVMVSGNQPAFSAYSSTATQSITTAVETKVQINTEVFDTASAFDSTTNYRFTPLVAGYYQVNGQIRIGGTLTGFCYPIIYKNGAAYKFGTASNVPASGSILTVNDIVYLNGSTDYIELYGVVTGTSPAFSNASEVVTSSFSAAMVRSA
jgi:hypothetical protein